MLQGLVFLTLQLFINLQMRFQSTLSSCQNLFIINVSIQNVISMNYKDVVKGWAKGKEIKTAFEIYFESCGKILLNMNMLG